MPPPYPSAIRIAGYPGVTTSNLLASRIWDAVEGICPELRRSRNRGHRWRRHDDNIVHFDEADFVTVYSVSLTLGDFIFIA